MTTNPREARGDALAMAYRFGALISDPEFVQFHPTAMDIDLDPAPLATEALRGEGAILVNRDGTPFMKRHHPKGDLAPRDEVARAVDIEVAAGRGACLDTRAAIGDVIEHHFPTVFAACEAAGIDPRTSVIPVAPAAHYHMGGIVTDLFGKTTLDGLSACGECASTGAHGANRLASNSLLEAVVFSARIADRLRDASMPTKALTMFDRPAPVVDVSDETLQTLRARMAESCGVVRTAEGLSGLLDWIAKADPSNGTSEPRALEAAGLIASAALERRESRGGHYRSDFPEASEAPRRTYLVKGKTGPLFLQHPVTDDGSS